MSRPDNRIPLHRTAILVLCIALQTTLAPGAETNQDDAGSSGSLLNRLETGETLQVKQALDGGSLLLEDGRVLRLAGIQAPPAPPWHKADRDWPPAERARALLAELAEGQSLQPAYDARREDRHGRLVAHVADSQGRWLQGELLRSGWARVQAFEDNRALLSEMLALERDAREAGRGLWTHSYYAVRRHDETGDDLGQFHLVEGRVLEVAIIAGRAYLNFGEDWRSDFTLVIDPAPRRRFEAEGLDPASFEGQRVRARGWLEFRNGVTINITHPEQIEVLE